MERHTQSSFRTRLIGSIVASALLVTGCRVTYNYYTLDSLEDVEWVVNTDANLNHGKEVTKCVAVWPDSLGHMVYLMRTKNNGKGMDKPE